MDQAGDAKREQLWKAATGDRVPEVELAVERLAVSEQPPGAAPGSHPSPAVRRSADRISRSARRFGSVIRGQQRSLSTSQKASSWSQSW